MTSQPNPPDPQPSALPGSVRAAARAVAAWVRVFLRVPPHPALLLALARPPHAPGPQAGAPAAAHPPEVADALSPSRSAPLAPPEAPAVSVPAPAPPKPPRGQTVLTQEFRGSSGEAEDRDLWVSADLWGLRSAFSVSGLGLGRAVPTATGGPPLLQGLQPAWAPFIFSEIKKNQTAKP